MADFLGRFDEKDGVHGEKNKDEDKNNDDIDKYKINKYKKEISTRPKMEDDDKIDDLVTSESILRHHRKLFTPHRNSIHLQTDLSKFRQFGANYSNIISQPIGDKTPPEGIEPCHLKLPSDRWDRTARRLSDPGGRGLYNFKAVGEAKWV